jgi:hypothetical protein
MGLQRFNCLLAGGKEKYQLLATLPGKLGFLQCYGAPAKKPKNLLELWLQVRHWPVCLNLRQKEAHTRWA